MAANPYDLTGTVDTTGYGLKSHAAQGGEDDGSTSVASVCPAFTDASLQADSDARLQPGQRLANRTY